MSYPAALSTPQPTQHALLIAWGYFAQSLALVDQFYTIPIPQKHGPRPPQVKLLSLLLGLLTGCEYLSDLSLGPAPVSCDPAVATAWGVPALASASGVSRTLRACPSTTLLALQRVLDHLMAPFLQ